MTIDDLTPEIKVKIKEIAAQHGAFNVRVFAFLAAEPNQNNDLDKINPWFPVRLKRQGIFFAK